MSTPEVSAPNDALLGSRRVPLPVKLAYTAFCAVESVLLTLADIWFGFRFSPPCRPMSC